MSVPQDMIKKLGQDDEQRLRKQATVVSVTEPPHAELSNFTVPDDLLDNKSSSVSTKPVVAGASGSLNNASSSPVYAEIPAIAEQMASLQIGHNSSAQAPLPASGAWSAAPLVQNLENEQRMKQTFARTQILLGKAGWPQVVCKDLADAEYLTKMLKANDLIKDKAKIYPTDPVDKRQPADHYFFRIFQDCYPAIQKRYDLPNPKIYVVPQADKQPVSKTLSVSSPK